MVEEITESSGSTSYTYYAILEATWNSGNNEWDATGSPTITGVTGSGDLTSYNQSTSSSSSNTQTVLEVYDLAMNQVGINPAGKYALEPQYNMENTLTGYRLTPVELDTSTSMINDDYITVANPTDIDISIADWTSAALTSSDSVGTFTITNAGTTGNTGNTGGYNGNANQTTVTEFGDRVQINVATSSTNSISSMINAAGGMDSLHLDGTNLFSDSIEDLDVSSDDAQITSQMLTNFGSSDFGVGNNCKNRIR